MKKYKTEFKLEVVQSFLAGEGGGKLLARRWSVPEEKVRTWVSHYRLHGIDGLRPKRSTYSAQFKLQVLSHQDREQLSSRQVAAIYDIRNPNQVVVWRRNLDQGRLQAIANEKEERPKMKLEGRCAALSNKVAADAVQSLREENERLRAEVAYLKKLQALNSVEEISCADKAHLIAGLRHHHKLAYLLQVAGLPRSTFYYQCQASQRAHQQNALEARIRTVYDEHKGRYGYRRITAALCNGVAEPVNHKCVQRLMQKMGLRALIRAKKRTWHVPGTSDAHVPNVLQRDFCATAPNLKWATDVTEFNISGQKLYLSACMDLYNGEIVAYRMARRPVFEMVSSMLEAALSRTNCVAGLIVHSDQGWHYKMQPYRAMLVRRGVEQSMSRKGNCFDNAAIESFFGTLKAEYFHLERPDSIDALEAGVHDYVHYYNHERIKLRLQGRRPVGYRLRNTT
ncbi:IS3 family transposase [Curvibacter sp. RS43]|uniref:IS3 family transposase n=1 Tax=Curvibacter microcysteis TaxID=3026419 RepID=UPI00235EB842|nr:IS3 family transposase [Curvibacter sp. RS43]MDD0812922.1 IS3 family transposase [Curvibacter sp. RS43]